MINWNRIAELKSDLGADDFQEVLALFLEEFEENLALLETQTPSEPDEILHFLKGSAANIGLQKVGEFCEIPTQSNIQDRIQDIRSAYDVSKQELLTREPLNPPT